MGHPGFVELRIARVRQDLVDASPGHHVAAQEQGQGIAAVLTAPLLLR